MSQKQILIRIYKDGTIKSQTKNIKGKKCMKYLNVIQELTDSNIVDSAFTAEYYEQEEVTEETSYIDQTNQSYV